MLTLALKKLISLHGIKTQRTYLSLCGFGEALKVPSGHPWKTFFLYLNVWQNPIIFILYLHNSHNKPFLPPNFA